jgi:hypothetical protein
MSGKAREMDVRPTSPNNRPALLFCITLVVLFLWAARSLSAQQMSGPVGGPVEAAALPDAPQLQVAPTTSDAHQVAPRKDCPPAPPPAGGPSSAPPAGGPQKNAGAGCAAPRFDFFHPFGLLPRTGPLTPKDKLRLAANNVADPFNLITIGGTAAITIGSDSHSDYGPGLKGWAKNSGTLLTEDMTGAFFITFLVPSLTHQDPRYHRMPNASIPRRIANAIVQPVWTQSDKGNHMLNYGDLIGVPATITLANVYVPDRQQGFGATAESSITSIASAPIDNFVTEFLPDVAKHVSIHIVLIQRIINQIAFTPGST